MINLAKIRRSQILDIFDFLIFTYGCLSWFLNRVNRVMILIVFVPFNYFKIYFSNQHSRRFSIDKCAFWFFFWGWMVCYVTQNVLHNLESIKYRFLAYFAVNLNILLTIGCDVTLFFMSNGFIHDGNTFWDFCIVIIIHLSWFIGVWNFKPFTFIFKTFIYGWLWRFRRFNIS